MIKVKHINYKSMLVKEIVDLIKKCEDAELLDLIYLLLLKADKTD